MAWWQRKKPIEERATLEDLLLGISVEEGTITKAQAMSIPSVAMAVNLISDTVASLPIKLYRKEDKDKVECVDDDPRVSLLNLDTKDTLDSYQWKKALVEDYLMYGAGYSYIHRQKNNVSSLHYLDNKVVSVVSDANPIFKKNYFTVYDSTFKDFEVIKLTRKTLNGATGVGVLTENNKPLSVAYNVMLFEDMLYRTGGNKKGFLKAQNRLSEIAMTELKNAFNNLYKNNNDSVIVLNNGLEFQEANNSSVEMQVNQNKITNAADISRIFCVPVELLNGKATGGNEIIYNSFIKMAILPILKAFETALNKDLLLEKEKGSFYFAFDTTELLKGDIEKRFKAYEIGVTNGILQTDEVRRWEDLEPLGLDFIKMNLGDVFFDPKTKQIYTPNTGQTTNVDGSGEPPSNPLEGGDNKNESGNQKQ